MWEESLNEPAAVQYGDWTGTVSGDDVDMTPVHEFLGIDIDAFRVLAIDVSIYGGLQSLKAYGVPSSMGWDELEGLVDRGEPIRCRVLNEIDHDPAHHFDTNPPPPLSFPVVAPTEYLGHGFKRLHIRLISRTVPSGAQLVCEYPEEGDED